MNYGSVNYYIKINIDSVKHSLKTKTSEKKKTEKKVDKEEQEKILTENIVMSQLKGIMEWCWMQNINEEEGVRITISIKHDSAPTWQTSEVLHHFIIELF